jgi:O-antigen/teichoic acid export membrane protein
LFITLVVGAYLIAKIPISAHGIMSLNVVAAGITLIFIAYLLRGILPPEVKDRAPKYETRAWLHSGFFIVLVGGMHVLNSRTDVLMLGAMTGAEAVGIYNIASRGADLINFILMPVHQAIGPTVSILYAKRDIIGLQRLVTKSTRIVLLLSLPLAAGLILMGRWFLLLYGIEFTKGHMALSILSIGQISTIALGPVALLLIMTRFERDAAIAVGMGAVLNIILNGLLIPVWGLEGAALATAVSKILWTLLMTMRVYQKLGIHPTILGRTGLRSSAT